MKAQLHLLLAAIVTAVAAGSIAGGCVSEQNAMTSDDSNLLCKVGYHPYFYHNGDTYYFTNEGFALDICFKRDRDIHNIRNSRDSMILTLPDSLGRIYAPELHRIRDRWYIYFEADDGVNTDLHRIFVYENPDKDPFTQNWTLHGPIITNDGFNFGIHPTVIEIKEKLYMLWSGWPSRRTETEVQCIYIAEMADPFTLRSKRVAISTPEYEWERQWINFNGNRPTYPIFVNENPQAVVSPDGRNVVVFYSASAVWTCYACTGMLHASTSSNLLDPKSWTKSPEPVFQTAEADSTTIYNTVVVNGDTPGQYYLTYTARRVVDDSFEVIDTRYTNLTWTEASLPRIPREFKYRSLHQQ